MRDALALHATPGRWAEFCDGLFANLPPPPVFIPPTEGGETAEGAQTGVSPMTANSPDKMSQQAHGNDGAVSDELVQSLGDMGLNDGSGGDSANAEGIDGAAVDERGEGGGAGGGDRIPRTDAVTNLHGLIKKDETKKDEDDQTCLRSCGELSQTMAPMF